MHPILCFLWRPAVVLWLAALLAACQATVGASEETKVDSVVGDGDGDGDSSGGAGDRNGDGDASGEGDRDGDRGGDAGRSGDGDGEVAGDGDGEVAGDGDGEVAGDGDGEVAGDGDGEVAGDGDGDGDGEVAGDGDGDGDGEVAGDVEDCQVGYDLDARGRCQDIDECLSGTARCGAGACENLPGSYRCRCEPGFQNNDRGRCVDVDECEPGATVACGAGATACSNLAGTFECTCGFGFVARTDQPACRERVWSPATAVDVGHGPVGPPVVVADAIGNVTVAWQQGERGAEDLWAVRFGSDGAWDSPTLLEQREGAATDPSLGVDAAGNVLVAWDQVIVGQQDIGYENCHVWANRFALGKGWGDPVLLESDTSSAREPAVAVAPSGSAVVLWKRGGAGFVWVAGNHYTPQDGWGEWETVAGVGVALRDGIGNPLTVAAADTGAMVVWEEIDSAQDAVVRAGEYSPSRGWDDPVGFLGDTRAWASYWPTVAMDAWGGAVALWVELPANDTAEWRDIRVLASYHEPGGDWDPPSLLWEGPGGPKWQPTLAINARGDAFAIWEDQLDHLLAVVHSPGDDLGKPMTVAQGEGIGLLEATIDAQGNAMAILHGSEQAEGGRRVWITGHVAGRGWIPTSSMPLPAEARRPKVAVDGLGIATVLWWQPVDDRMALYASRFE